MPSFSNRNILIRLLLQLWEMDALRKSIPNPQDFNPKNQMTVDGQLKPFVGSHSTFGWGRRVCIGQPFAERGVYTMMSHLLWAFDISAPDGPPDVNNISRGMPLVYFLPLQCLSLFFAKGLCQASRLFLNLTCLNLPRVPPLISRCVCAVVTI